MTTSRIRIGPFQEDPNDDLQTKQNKYYDWAAAKDRETSNSFEMLSATRDLESMRQTQQRNLASYTGLAQKYTAGNMTGYQEFLDQDTRGVSLAEQRVAGIQQRMQQASASYQGGFGLDDSAAPPRTERIAGVVATPEEKAAAANRREIEWSGTDAGKRAAGTTASLAADLKAEAGKANPFRTPARADYHPSEHGIPLNMDEVAVARQWLMTDDSYGFIQIGVDPRNIGIPGGGTRIWMNVRTGMPATADEIQKAENRSFVIDAINKITTQDSAFRTTQALNVLDLSKRAEENRLQELFDKQQREAEAEIADKRVTVDRDVAAALDKTQREQIRARGDEDIRRLTLEGRQAMERAKQQHAAALAEIASQGIENRYTLELKSRFDIGLVEREGQIRADLEHAQMQFHTEQNALDRALKALDLQEANRAATAAEALKGQQIAIEQQQFKLGVFQTLAQSPEILYFLGKQGGGALQQFGDLFGDGGKMLTEVMTRIQAQPPVNIQDFASMGEGEQGIQRFALAAQTGAKNTTAALRGQAPRAVINPTRWDAPIMPGSPGPSDRIRLGRGNAEPTR